MSLIYRLLGWFYVLFIGLSVLVVIALFFALPSRCGRSVRRVWANFVLCACGIRVQFRGTWHSGTRLLIINHSSILDIIVLEALHGADLCWLAKKEIAALPVFGQIIKKPGMISVDRANAREFVRSMEVAKERVEQGRVLAIFPEGTRSDGLRLRQFKKGALMIKDRLALSAQPVVIAGSRRAMDSVGGPMVRPFSKVIVKALEPNELNINELHALMQLELDALNAELGAATKETADEN